MGHTRKKAIKELRKFVAFTKVEETKEGTLLVHGLLTAEKPDLDDEVCDYDKSKPYFKALVERYIKATSQVDGMKTSLFPLREMHQLKAVGAGRGMEFDDEKKTIMITAEVVEPDAVLKVSKGVLIGFSQGGRYVDDPVPDPVFPGCMRYVSDPGEASLVDAPCLPDALIDSIKEKTFAYTKSDGSTELRKFQLKKDQAAIDKAKKKIQAVIGRLKGETTTTVQSVIFSPKSAWTEKECKDWLKEHDLKAPAADETEDSYRFRQRDPGDFKDGSFRTIPFKGGKVKTYAGEELESDCFAYVGDVKNSATWKLPIKLSTPEKTKTAIRGGLLLFEKQNIPDDARQKTRQTLFSAAKIAGLDLADEVDKLTDARSGFQKGLMTVQDMASCLMTMSWIQDAVAWEREMEGDDSKLPDDLAALLDEMVDCFIDLVEEETSELLEAAHRGRGAKKAMDPKELEKLQKAHTDLQAVVKEKDDAIAKAKDHMKAIHGAVGKAMAHHVKMAAHHDKMADHHTKIHKAVDELAEHHEMHAGELDAAMKATDGTDGYGAVKKAAAHHDKMHKMHKAHADTHKVQADHHEKMADYHKAHADHLGNVQKAVKAAMDDKKPWQVDDGDDGDDDDKALRHGDFSKALEASPMLKEVMAMTKANAEQIASLVKAAGEDTPAIKALKESIEKQDKLIAELKAAGDPTFKVKGILIPRPGEGISKGEAKSPTMTGDLTAVGID